MTENNASRHHLHYITRLRSRIIIVSQTLQIGTSLIVKPPIITQSKEAIGS